MVRIMRKKNRTLLDIIYDVVSLAVAGGTKKTHLMYRANLSYEYLSALLPFLKEKGLVEEKQDPDTGGKLFYAGESGLKFIESVHTIRDVLAVPEDEPTFSALPMMGRQRARKEPVAVEVVADTI